MNSFQSVSFQNSYATSDAQSALLRSVFCWMAAGLALTGAVSSYVLGNEALLEALFSPGKLILLSLIELGLVAWLSIRVMKMDSTTATGVFLAYSALNGITLAPLGLMYTGASIASAFAATAGMFGGMALFGAVTKRDLSSWGSFLMMGLWGIIISGLVNIFLRSEGVSFMMSCAAVVVFTGLTAYDVFRIKQYSAGVTEGTPDFRRFAIIGALSLYLNFINLFIHMLRFFGDRRN